MSTPAQQKLMKEMLALSRDETDKLLRAKGVPGIETYYNRLSIEHDIPLGVAEAMVRCAGVFNIQMLGTHNLTERMAIASTYSAIWKNLAAPLGMPEEKMIACIKAAIQSAIDVTDRADKAVDEMLKEAEEKAKTGEAAHAPVGK